MQRHLNSFIVSTANLMLEGDTDTRNKISPPSVAVYFDISYWHPCHIAIL